MVAPRRLMKIVFIVINEYISELLQWRHTVFHTDTSLCVFFFMKNDMVLVWDSTVERPPLLRGV